MSSVVGDAVNCEPRSALNLLSCAVLRYLSNIDYLIRLEDFDVEFANVRERARERNGGKSDAWFDKQISSQRLAKTYRNHVSVDDVFVHWIDVCARDDLREQFHNTGKDGLNTLLHHYSWMLYRRY